jgi:hypothetical protein
MTGSIDPTRPQFDAFKALPRDQPIHMLNLVRVRPLAVYPEGHPNHGKGMAATARRSSSASAAGRSGPDGRTSS